MENSLGNFQLEKVWEIKLQEKLDGIYNPVECNWICQMEKLMNQPLG